jgi:quercetin dioxygenase-like cupin family protein
VTTRAGDIYENPVTGERVVLRVGSAATGGRRLVADLYVRPGGAVAGEHVHPTLAETFTVVRGRVGFRLAGREEIAAPGRRLHVPPGQAHDWWNAGGDEAHVLVELETDVERFEAMILNMFNLARDGKTDPKGRPHLLQLALVAREFDDVIRLTRPPRWAQRLLFGVLAPIARARGYRGSYPEYLNRGPVARVAPAAADAA